MKTLLLILLTSFSHAGATPEEHFSHLPAGGRRSLHGMVLFGSGRYFLEHIPMLTPPHDFQVVAEVRLVDGSGQAVARDFSQRGFTLKPSANFSLNDYVAGRLKKFSGAVHTGSFEQNGPVVPGLGAVNVEVVEYKLIRQLPAKSADLVFRVSDGVSTFETNIIRPEGNRQIIRNATSGAQLWCVVGPDFFEPCR